MSLPPVRSNRLLDRILRNDGISLDLDQPPRIDQAAHLHNGARRPDLSEELPVDDRDGLPILNTRKEHTSPEHVGKVCACLLKCFPDDLETPPRLHSWITRANRSSVWRDRGRARDRDDAAFAHGTRKANLRLVWAAARYPSALVVHASIIGPDAV